MAMNKEDVKGKIRDIAELNPRFNSTYWYDLVSVTEEAKLHEIYTHLSNIEQLLKAESVPPPTHSVEEVVEWLSEFPRIGTMRARRLVDLFGLPNLWTVMEHEPERLAEVQGINVANAEKIHEEYVSRMGERLALFP
jgi:ERCC4-type nuclease